MLSALTTDTNMASVWSAQVTNLDTVVNRRSLCKCFGCLPVAPGPATGAASPTTEQPEARPAPGPSHGTVGGGLVVEWDDSTNNTAEKK